MIIIKFFACFLRSTACTDYKGQKNLEKKKFGQCSKPDLKIAIFGQIKSCFRLRFFQNFFYNLVEHDRNDQKTKKKFNKFHVSILRKIELKRVKKCVFLNILSCYSAKNSILIESKIFFSDSPLVILQMLGSQI